MLSKTLPALFSSSLLTAVLLAIGALPASAQLKIVGSDLFQDALKQPIADFAEKTKQPIEMEMDGTWRAMRLLEDGKADVALVAAPEGKFEVEDGYWAAPLAYQIGVVVVHVSNPISELSFNQLGAIYSSSANENYTRWGDLVQTGPWRASSIQPVAVSPDDGVLLALFKHTVLENGSLKPNVNLVPTDASAFARLNAEPSTIAIVHRAPTQNDSLKAVSISNGEPGAFAFGPTPENVHYGDYPIRLSFWLVLREDRLTSAEEFIFYLLGDDVSKVLDQDGFMPVSGNVRKKSLLELDMRN